MCLHVYVKYGNLMYMYNSDFIRQLWESNKNTSYTNYFTRNAVLNTVQWKNSKQKHWDLWDRDKATERRQMYKKRDRLFLTTWNFRDHLFCDFEAHILRHLNSVILRNWVKFRNNQATHNLFPWQCYLNMSLSLVNRLNKNARAGLYVNSNIMWVTYTVIFMSCYVRDTYCSRHFNCKI